MFLVCFDEQLCVCTRCRLWRITGIILSGEHDQPDWLAQWEKLMQAQSSAKGGCCFRNKTLAWQNRMFLYPIENNTTEVVPEEAPCSNYE